MPETQEPSEPRNIVDTVMKELFLRIPDLATRLLQINMEGIGLLADTPIAKTRTLHPDVRVVLLREGKPYGAFCVENQIKPEPKKLSTQLAKCLLLEAEYDYPHVLLVIYLKRGNYKTFPNEHLSLVEGYSNRHLFVSLNLWEVEERIERGELTELAPLLLVIANLDRNLKSEAEVEQAKSVIAHERQLILESNIAAEHRALLLAACISIATKALNTQTLKHLLEEEINMLKEAPLFQEWVEEAKVEAREEGRVLGLEEGKELGVMTTTQSFTLRLLKAKFGDYPESLEAKVRSSDTDWCLRLLDRLETSNDLDELDINSLQDSRVKE